MKKTLLDLYQSASEAAAKALDLSGMALLTAKVEACQEAKIADADCDVWGVYFDEQHARYSTLRKTLAPSQPKETPAA